MFRHLKNTWHRFKTGEPGHRFHSHYERRREECGGKIDCSGLINILAGALIAIVGLFLIPAPGPGTIILFVGLSLIGSEIEPLALALDRAEVRVRKIADKSHHLWRRTGLRAKLIISLVLFVCAAGITYSLYDALLGKWPGIG